MSELSFIEKLLGGVTVEWKELSEVFHLKNGYTPSKSKKEYWENGTIPWFRMDDLRENGSILNDSLQKVSNQAVKSGKIFPANSIIVSTSATIGEHALIKVPFLANQRFTCLTLKNEYGSLLDIKFLYYYCFLLSEWCTKNTTQSSFASVEMDGFKKYPIPIPCPENPEKSLQIQAEIVRILDAFTKLTAELTAELSARKKQYNYYRDKLLSFENSEVEWKPLGDIIKKSYSGGTPTAGNPEYYDGGSIPWLRTQEVKFTDIESVDVMITPAALKNSATKWIPENCVIVAISGATAGRSAINKIPLTTNQHCCCLDVDPEKALYRYVFHWVSCNYENLKALGQGARGDLNSGIIKGFQIPIPFPNDPARSLTEQERIVSILDKFDALTNSITEGLPREIELRQKQYEYYRDLLLSFPKLEQVEV
ncbi:restriction endonuclease subunit S [Alkalimonas collagenimarina]|uniref:Restriction endonuclease subunit S n=1 Tax=Alkalimonas collagenimarina TaxID=400390 RepID=A0ABT9GXJ2_9GAMM|nr:restriction endonuclease subunit S [Alkalimonas collagenimarina]MDP4535584.1 restriction endonuclease subunit S [Alkalimonas collagenimarina]